MDDLTITFHTTTTSHTTTTTTSPTITSTNNKSKRKFNGATMMVRLTKTRNTDVRISFHFFLQSWKCVDENYMDFNIYMKLLGRSKVGILLDDWGEFDGD